jgi:hypothetical protein
MSEEDLKDFMQNPENQAMMKVSRVCTYIHAQYVLTQMLILFASLVRLKEFLDRIMGMIMSQLPPGALQGAEEGERVEVKVHMIPVNMASFGPNGMQMGPNGMPMPGFPRMPMPMSFPHPHQAQLTAASPPEPEPKPAVEEKGEKEEENRSDREKEKSKGGLSSFSFLRNIRGKSKEKADKDEAAKTSDMDGRLQNDLKDRKGRGEASGAKRHTSDDPRKGSRSGKTSESRNSASSTSASGEALMAAFEPHIMEAPRDQSLKNLWDRMADEETGNRIAKANRKLLARELRHWGLWSEGESEYDSKLLRSLDDALQKQVLSEQEVHSVVTSAVKLQAGRLNVFNDGHGTAATPTRDLAPESASSSSSSQDTVAPDGATRVGRVRPFELTHWALDSALSGILKGPNPRLGRPSARSKEDIAAMVTDKHERALIPNVISPQVRVRVRVRVEPVEIPTHFL